MGLYYDAEARTFKVAESTSDDEREVAAGGVPALAAEAHRAVERDALGPPRLGDARAADPSYGP
eukprot:6615495-Alexandrium_andersonii.AAC.1